MTGYYHAKRTLLAKQYIEMREAEQKIGPVDNRLARSRAWLEKYQARPRRTSLNWAPRWPINSTPPEDQTNAEVTKEGSEQVVAHADARGSEAGEGGEKPGARRRPTRAGSFDTPF